MACAVAAFVPLRDPAVEAAVEPHAECLATIRGGRVTRIRLEHEVAVAAPSRRTDGEAAHVAKL